MNTQASKTLEENINTAGKWFSESAIAMSEIYNKQFKLGYDILANYLNTGLNNGKRGQGFNPDLFRSGVELLRSNIENFSGLSEKTMSIFLNSYSGKETGSDESRKIIETVTDAYNFQIKQVAEMNRRFFETFSGSFKATNGDIEKSYSNFRKTTEDNFRVAEEAIKRAVQSYSSIANKSAKDREEMLADINEQVEFLTQSSLKLWSDLLQVADTENHKPGSREKGKRKVKVNRSKK